jgi:ESF2/ABP1 family protein
MGKSEGCIYSRKVRRPVFDPDVLQTEWMIDPKRAYLRRKYTSTKKHHYTEGWVEFKDKHVARSVATMLNAQPIGGKKGTRWRDDVWTMKYLPKFKWNMLTEQIGA